jgi:hypothetical protein
MVSRFFILAVMGSRLCLFFDFLDPPLEVLHGDFSDFSVLL